MRVRPYRHAEATKLIMTAENTTPESGESVTESTDIEIDAIMGKATVPPEGARLELKEIQPAEGAPVVNIDIRCENLSGRLMLTPEQAASVGRELLELSEK